MEELVDKWYLEYHVLKFHEAYASPMLRCTIPSVMLFPTGEKNGKMCFAEFRLIAVEYVMVLCIIEFLGSFLW